MLDDSDFGAKNQINHLKGLSSRVIDLPESQIGFQPLKHSRDICARNSEVLVCLTGRGAGRPNG